MHIKNVLFCEYLDRGFCIPLLWGLSFEKFFNFLRLGCSTKSESDSSFNLYGLSDDNTALAFRFLRLFACFIVLPPIFYFPFLAIDGEIWMLLSGGLFLGGVWIKMWKLDGSMSIVAAANLGLFLGIVVVFAFFLNGGNGLLLILEDDEHYFLFTFRVTDYTMAKQGRWRVKLPLEVLHEKMS